MSYAKSAPRKVTRLADVTATIESVAEKTETEVKSAAAAMQEKLTENMHKATETARTMFEFQKGAMQTMLASGKIYSEGLQSLATHAAAVNKLQFDETMAALRTLAGTRSVTEAMRLQTELARTTATRAMTESTKLVKDYVKLAEQAVAPLTAKVHEAAEKFAKAA
jgi:hypothetical protein